MLDKDCVFCKIIRGEIPADKVYEDKDMIIIKDINPEAKIHLLLLPKAHYAGLDEMSGFEGIALAKCLGRLPKLQKQLGLEDGYRLVVNRGKNGRQSVFHLHIHIFGGELLPDKLKPVDKA